MRSLEPYKTCCRIAVWGMGAVYQRRLPQLRLWMDRGWATVVAALDMIPRDSQLRGVPSMQPHELDPRDVDLLVITNTKDAAEIKERAVHAYGFEAHKVVDHAIMDLVDLDPRWYVQFRAKPVSFVSDTSWGSMMYKALQLQPRSPFVGTFVKRQDYLKLLSNLHYYLSIEQPRYRGERIDWKGRSYHSFQFDDIEVRMMARFSPDVALRTWQDRCSLLSENRMLVQMSTVDSYEESRFEQLECHPRRICFVPYVTHNPHSLQIAVAREHKIYRDAIDSLAAKKDPLMINKIVNLLCHDEGNEHERDCEYVI